MILISTWRRPESDQCKQLRNKTIATLMCRVVTLANLWSQTLCQQGFKVLEAPYIWQPSCSQLLPELAHQWLINSICLFLWNCKANWMLTTGLQSIESIRQEREVPYIAKKLLSGATMEAKSIPSSRFNLHVKDLTSYLWDHDHIGTHTFHCFKNLTSCSWNSYHSSPATKHNSF